MALTARALRRRHEIHSPNHPCPTIQHLVIITVFFFFFFSRSELIWIIWSSINHIPLNTPGIWPPFRCLRQIFSSYLNEDQLVPQMSHLVKGFFKKKVVRFFKKSGCFIWFFSLIKQMILILGFPKIKTRYSEPKVPGLLKMTDLIFSSCFKSHSFIQGCEVSSKI